MNFDTVTNPVLCRITQRAYVGKLFSTRRLSSCTDEYAHTYDISTYSVKQWSRELGLGFSLRAARVYTHRIYIHATCKRHLEQETHHRDEIANVNFLYDVAVYVLRNTKKVEEKTINMPQSAI